MLHRRLTTGITAFCTLSLFLSPGAVCSAAGYEPVQAEIPVACVVENSQREHTFRIEMESVSANCPTPSPDTLTVSEGKTEQFTVTLDEPGTFLYRVFEISGTDDSFEYDTTVYNVTVYAEQDGDGSLIWAVSAKIEGSDKKPERIEFLDKSNEETQTTATETSVTETVTETTTESTTALTTTEESTTQAVTTDTTERTTASASRLIDRINDVLTGDFTPVRLMFTLTFAAAGVALVTGLLRKKKRDDTDSDEPDTDL
ncbi:MAG: hypothetical protein IKQ39_06025 [Oscillospiraceae bacterium]|nr:hypothetical protein [Oscillospiraceae bacterium]